jgi:hypothetical protein
MDIEQWTEIHAGRWSNSLYYPRIFLERMRKTVKIIGLSWPKLNSGLIEKEGRVLAL